MAAATAASAPYWADHRGAAEQGSVPGAAARRVALAGAAPPRVRRGALVRLLRGEHAAHGWPYSPRFFGYTFVCPELYGHRTCRADAPLAALGDESRGVALERVGPARAYRVEMYGMSCALCAELRRRLGAPPYVLPTAVDHDARYRRMGLANASAGWVNLWDVHTFGLWLATELWPSQRTDPSAALEEIHRYRISNGEEIHAFLWGSMALLAEHELRLRPAALGRPRVRPLVRARRRGQCRVDVECAHGAGHGFYMFYQRDARGRGVPGRAAARRGGWGQPHLHREGELWSFWSACASTACGTRPSTSSTSPPPPPRRRRRAHRGRRQAAALRRPAGLCASTSGCRARRARLRLVADGECDAFDEPALVAAERDEKTRCRRADEPRWTNGFGLGCGDYVSKGYAWAACAATRTPASAATRARVRVRRGRDRGRARRLRAGSPPPPGAPPPPPKVARNRTVAAARTAGRRRRGRRGGAVRQVRGKYVGGAKREGGGAVSVFDIGARHGLPWG